jgi:hypothetical protein
MKIISVIIAVLFLITGCGSPKELTVEGHTKKYPTYGFLNENSSKSSNVCYEISIGNVLWSIVLWETVVAPVYFIGYSLYNPVSVKVDGKCPGIDSTV